MKKLLLSLVMVVTFIGMVALNANAAPITGAISFSGSTVLDDMNDFTLAKAFTTFASAVVSSTGGEGEYTDILKGEVTLFTPFVFDPFVSVMPLWTFTFAGTTYSFDALTLDELSKTSSTIALSGTGIAKISDFPDTSGYWSLTANRAGSTGSFSASSDLTRDLPQPIPEPGTMLLLGAGLVGFGAFFRRKFEK